MVIASRVEPASVAVRELARVSEVEALAVLVEVDDFQGMPRSDPLASRRPSAVARSRLRQVESRAVRAAREIALQPSDRDRRLASAPGSGRSCVCSRGSSYDCSQPTDLDCGRRVLRRSVRRCGGSRGTVARRVCSPCEPTVPPRYGRAFVDEQATAPIFVTLLADFLLRAAIVLSGVARCPGGGGGGGGYPHGGTCLALSRGRPWRRVSGCAPRRHRRAR